MQQFNFIFSFFLALFSLSLLATEFATEQPVRLNQLQVIGSHNSYKSGLHTEIAKQINQIQTGYADKINYAHPDLSKQLDMGLRQLEIDVLADSYGGRYLQPFAQRWTQTPLHNTAQKQALKAPGFKVLHIPDIDVATHCIQLKDCLLKLKNWSSQHPSHLPVYILFNVKESHWKKIDGTVPEMFTTHHYQEFDQLIGQILGPEKLISPDDLIRSGYTLAESITTFGWPTLQQARGKFVFIFDANARQLDLFEQANTHHIFAAFPVTHPNAAFLIYNHPVRQAEQIKQAIEQGFIVRTRADEFNQNQSPKNRAFNAIRSGAQIISTDFYKGALQTPLNAPFVSFNLISNRPVGQNTPFARCIRLAPDSSCPL